MFASTNVCAQGWIAKMIKVDITDDFDLKKDDEVNCQPTHHPSLPQQALSATVSVTLATPVLAGQVQEKPRRRASMHVLSLLDILFMPCVHVVAATAPLPMRWLEGFAHASGVH